MPAVLREACGFYYQEFSNLKDELALKADPYRVGDKDNKVSIWAEFIVPETATALAFYEHPFFGKYPAITRNRYGKGTVTYEGTVLSDKIQEKVMLEVLNLAGLTGPDQQLPQSVRVKHGISNTDRTLHYYLNYSGENQTFNYPYKAGEDVLTSKQIEESQALTLAGWDVIIIEER